MCNIVVCSTGTIAVLCGILLLFCAGLPIAVASSGSATNVVARRGREPAKFTATSSTASPIITPVVTSSVDDSAAADDYDEDDDVVDDEEDFGLNSERNDYVEPVEANSPTAEQTPTGTSSTTAPVTLHHVTASTRNEIIKNSTSSLLTSPITARTTTALPSGLNGTTRARNQPPDDFNEASLPIDNEGLGNVQGTGMTGLTLRGHSDIVEGSGGGAYIGMDRARMMPGSARSDPDAEDDQDVSDADGQIEGSGAPSRSSGGSYVGGKPVLATGPASSGEMDGQRFMIPEGSGTTPRDHFVEENLNTVAPGSHQVTSTATTLANAADNEIVFSTPDGDKADAELKEELGFKGEVEHKISPKNANLLAQPAMLAAVIGGAVVGLLCAILLVMYLIYRMRKKDEGSYALDEPAKRPGGYMRAPTNSGKEYYA